MEKNKHGFVHQDQIMKYENLKETSYTKHIDSIQTIGGKVTGIEFKSVKNKNEICFADFISKFDLTLLDVIRIYITFWTGDKLNPKVTKLVRCDIKYKVFIEYLGGKQFYSVVEEFNRILKNEITNSYSDDLKWKKVREDFTKRSKEYKTLFKIRGKRDHKNQRRTQTAISQKNFFEGIVNDKRNSVKIYDENEIKNIFNN